MATMPGFGTEFLAGTARRRSSHSCQAYTTRLPAKQTVCSPASGRGASTWAACSCQDSFLRGEQGAYRRSKVVLTCPSCSTGLCRVSLITTRPYAVPLRGQRTRECERRDVGVCALEILCAQTSRERHRPDREDITCEYIDVATSDLPPCRSSWHPKPLPSAR